MKHKKFLIFAVVLAGALLAATTSLAVARGLQHGQIPFGPSAQSSPDGDEVWGFGHGMGWHWDDDHDQDHPPMMEAMIAGLAGETSLSQDEILARLAEGEHLLFIALDAGISQEAFNDLMVSVREEVFTGRYDDYSTPRSHMWSFKDSSGPTEDDVFTPPCHGWDGTGNPVYGNPSRGRGRDW